jgi:hypothetical protein
MRTGNESKLRGRGNEYDLERDGDIEGDNFSPAHAEPLQLRAQSLSTIESFRIGNLVLAISKKGCVGGQRSPVLQIPERLQFGVLDYGDHEPHYPGTLAGRRLNDRLGISQTFF